MSVNPLSRRDLLRLGLAAGAASSLGLPAFAEQASKPSAAPLPSTSSYLDAAVKAATWIHTARVQTSQGLIWLEGPERPEGLESTQDLYTGSAGVVLFLLELAKVTGDKAYKDDAGWGADALLASLPEKLDPAQGEAGFYAGHGGIGFTLHQTFQATGEEKFRQGAVRCRDLIHAAAQPAGQGVEWGKINDIISGASGIGLYLLDYARTMNDPASRDLAVRTGLRLVELGIPEGGGLKWRSDPTFPRLMPNFSHGTAGVCYFLATLHQETGRKEFLDAALAGARYLQSIAVTTGDTCLIFHGEPDHKDLYYLGWCHGPVGTSRLWVRLDQIDPKAGWLAWAKKGAKGIQDSGIPEKQTPGFWNNVSQCCGSASVASFFLDLAKLTGDATYKPFAHRVVQNILDRATPTPGGGLKWIQAENRVQPDRTYAQTGYMQGAAGIGMLMLRMDAEEKGRGWGFRLPDSPYA